MAGTLTAATIDSGAASTAPVFRANGTQIGTLCRAWVYYNASAQTVVGSFNVTSVTRTATAAYTVTFTNSMPDTAYAVVATSNGSASTNGPQVCYPVTYATGSIALQNNVTNTTSISPTIVGVAIFR